MKKLIVAALLGITTTTKATTITAPPAISHRNTRYVDRAGKYFLEYAA